MLYLKKLNSIILIVILGMLTGSVSGDVYAEPESPVTGPDCPARAQDTAQPDAAPAACSWLESASPRLLGLQFDGVYQNMPGFKSPYQGVHSLTSTNGEGQDVTSTYGVYLGSQLASTTLLFKSYLVCESSLQ